MAVALAVAALAVTSAGDARGDPLVREWRFAATLDGRPIGEHLFRVTDRDGGIDVESRASFDVRLFGFSVYTYEHRATERWKDGCLEALDARTDDNGDVAVVAGAKVDGGFEVKRDGHTTRLPPCTMTFAYWNPAIRTQSRLLNPQTGAYLDVSVEDEGLAKLDELDAERWTIRGKELEIDVWYDAAGRWLALDSRQSRKVSYRQAATATSARDDR